MELQANAALDGNHQSVDETSAPKPEEDAESETTSEEARRSLLRRRIQQVVELLRREDAVENWYDTGDGDNNQDYDDDNNIMDRKSYVAVTRL